MKGAGRRALGPADSSCQLFNLPPAALPGGSVAVDPARVRAGERGPDDRRHEPIAACEPSPVVGHRTFSSIGAHAVSGENVVARAADIRRRIHRRQGEKIPEQGPGADGREHQFLVAEAHRGKTRGGDGALELPVLPQPAPPALQAQEPCGARTLPPPPPPPCDVVVPLAPLPPERIFS